MGALQMRSNHERASSIYMTWPRCLLAYFGTYGLDMAVEFRPKMVSMVVRVPASCYVSSDHTEASSRNGEVSSSILYQQCRNGEQAKCVLSSHCCPSSDFSSLLD